MNLGRTWDIIHSVLRKESRGNIIKPDRFTYLLQQCGLEYYNEQYEKWAGSQTIIDSLKPFVVVDETATFASGEFTISGLANTYKHFIGGRVSSSDAPCAYLPPHVWSAWIGDAVMAGTTTYPIITADSTKLYVSPTSITNIKVSYLKAPTDPVFDYYIDANYTVQYFANGETHTLLTDEVGSGGETAGTEVTSTSVEFEWGDQDIVNIISKILEKVGVGMQANDVAQYAMAVGNKQNVM